MTSLRDQLTHQSNDYRSLVNQFTNRTGHGWHDISRSPTSPTVSVVIPARDAESTLGAVLDALSHQCDSTPAEVIVVDDASTDLTAVVARNHPVNPRVVSLGHQYGAGQARDVGVAIASGDVIVFVDADMLLPEHALTTMASRAYHNMIVLGFRHNLPYHDGWYPRWPANLNADHRVAWRARPGRYHHTGLELDQPVDARPLDETRNLLDLGHAATYYDWDLPRMVVTCLLALPRQAVLDVGGFHPGFTGWGHEDTYLGAALIAAGHKVAPLRHVVGYHLDPPDAEASWERKRASWRRNIALYQYLLDQPPPTDGPRSFTTRTNRLLADSEVPQ